MNERLYRTRDDRIIFGVAGGVAENFNLDPSLVRILWVILTPLTGGLLFLLYVVMAFVVPEEPEGAPWPGWGQPHHAGGGPAAATGATAGSPAMSGPSGAPGSGGAFEAGVSASSAGPGSTPGPAGVGPPTAPGAPTSGNPSAAGHGTPVAQMPGFLPPSMAGAPNPSPGTVPPVPPIPAWQPGAPPPGSAPGGPVDWRAQRRADRQAHRAARRAARGNGYEGSAGVIGGVVLVLIGGYFIVRTYVPTLDLGRFWPILLVAIGLILLLGSIRRDGGPPHV